MRTKVGFYRPFEEFFAFWGSENWGCFKPAESPTETLATQATLE